MGYPRFQRARAFKSVTKSAGSYVITGATFAALDTTTDLVLEAQTGDVVEVTPCGLWGSEAYVGEMDVATVVNTTVTNYISGNARGVGGWAGQPSQYSNIGAPWLYTLAAGDIYGGTVTLRVMTRLLSAGSKTLFASSGSYTFQFSARNLGPSDPH